MLIKLDSSGPILYRQKRYGYKGSVFGVYKFRTMRAGKQDGRQRFLGIAVKGFFQLLWLKPVRERLFVFLAVVLPVLIQQIPNLLGTPGRDVGGYAYGGWRISHGEVLYRDVWDHKPPLLYFVYAGLFRIFSPEMRWAALFELA